MTKASSWSLYSTIKAPLRAATDPDAHTRAHEPSHGNRSGQEKDNRSKGVDAVSG